MSNKIDFELNKADLGRLQGKLGKLKNLQAHLQKAGHNALRSLLATRPAYPPQRPGQSYHRTMALGQSLSHMAGRAPGALSRVESMSGGVQVTYGTGIPYAQWVVSEARQAWMHRGRWWTMEKHMLSQAERMVEVFQSYIAKLIKE